MKLRSPIGYRTSESSQASPAKSLLEVFKYDGGYPTLPNLLLPLARRGVEIVCPNRCSPFPLHPQRGEDAPISWCSRRPGYECRTNALLDVSWKGTTSICRAASLGTERESSSVIIATGIVRNGMGHSVVQENSNTTFKQSEPWEREQKKGRGHR